MRYILDERVFQIAVEFGATFTGTLFGFALAFWYDRYVKRKEELGIKIRILEAIDLELELNMDSISKETFLEDEIHFPSLPFTRNALNSSIGGGDFSKLDPDIQKAISQLYIIFFEAENTSKKIFSFWERERKDYLQSDVFQSDMGILKAAMEVLGSEIPKLRDGLQKRIQKFRARY